MEFDIKAIDFDADVYDVRKALEVVLHGPDLYDPNNPRNKGRTPNFEVVLRESPAGRIHNGTGILRVTNFVGNNLHRWITDSSSKNKILVKGRALRLSRTSRQVSSLVKQQLEKALYVGPEKEKSARPSRTRPDKLICESQKFNLACGTDNPTHPQIMGGHFLSSMSTTSCPKARHTSL